VSKRAWSFCPARLAPTSRAEAYSIPLQTTEHVVITRQAVRQRAIDLGFSLVDQTKIVTAASELARNAIQHGGGGSALVEVLIDGPRRGLRLTFEDHGPGIPDIPLAMRDGYSSKGGLGLGLSGAKRLSNEFAISSSQAEGTRVVITRWK
jgi:serine/threonine-protein kinase RsbT